MDTKQRVKDHIHKRKSLHTMQKYKNEEEEEVSTIKVVQMRHDKQGNYVEQLQETSKYLGT